MKMSVKLSEAELHRALLNYVGVYTEGAVISEIYFWEFDPAEKIEFTVTAQGAAPVLTPVTDVATTNPVPHNSEAQEKPETTSDIEDESYLTSLSTPRNYHDI